jgi:DNA-binding NarL/FixJ family response regulator
MSVLTSREVEAITLVAQGWTDAEIAVRFVLQKDSVTALMSRVITKLGARNRAHAVALCFRSGVLK